MQPLIILGFGNMGAAIVAGALRANVLHPQSVVVVDPSPDRRSDARNLGLVALDAARDALDRSPAAPVLLCIKPQALPAAAADLAPLGDRLVLSILAGVPSDTLRARLGTSRVIRAMPNTPALVGRGITAIDDAADPADTALARRLFEAVGVVVPLPEHLFDAFTALAASGPAYLFHLAEAMIAAAEPLGFSPDQGRAIVRATLSGSAELLARSPEPPETLRARVTSKGGTTAAATAILESRAVHRALVDAIIAARDRASELGRRPGSA